jgi:hypothetical protein
MMSSAESLTPNRKEPVTARLDTIFGAIDLRKMAEVLSYEASALGPAPSSQNV